MNEFLPHLPKPKSMFCRMCKHMQSDGDGWRTREGFTITEKKKCMNGTKKSDGRHLETEKEEKKEIANGKDLQLQKRGNLRMKETERKIKFAETETEKDSNKYRILLVRMSSKC
jgi:hypothetical protein